MAWFKIDDRLWAHPKWVGLSDAAQALWIRSGTWSASHLTNGFIPKTAYRVLNARKRTIDELLAAGLWEVAENGVMFHDWNVYQLTREQVAERREKTAARVAEWRERKRIEGDGNAVTPASPQSDRNAVTNAAPVPDPNPYPYPYPSPSGEERGPDPTTRVGAAFEQVWSFWPRAKAGQDSRSKAWTTFLHAVNQSFNGNIAALVGSMRVWAEAYDSTGDSPMMCPGIPRWLNDEKWRDPLPQRTVQKSGHRERAAEKMEDTQDSVEMGRRLQAQYDEQHQPRAIDMGDTGRSIQ